MGQREEQIRARRKIGALYEHNGHYYCNLHCPICTPDPLAQITDPRRLWALGERHRNHIELDEEGICGKCEYYMGQAELDRREAEAEIAMERAYEEQDDYSPDYYEAQNNLQKAMNSLMGYESPEQKRRHR